MHSGNHFPRQKKPISKKGDDWRKECVDAAQDLAIYRDSGVRRSYFNKKSNYNLYRDILDQADVKRATNQFGLKSAQVPAKMQNYPVANRYIDFLAGEEFKMNLDLSVRVTNDSAISEKEFEKKRQLKELVVKSIQDDDKSQEDIKQELEQEKKYLDTKYQDARERRATHILRHLIKKDHLDKVFNDGFYDALISGEEIYQADIIAGEPTLFRLDPLNVHTVRSGESDRIEDSDIIIIDGYHSPSKIIDDYHDHLTEEQVEFIESEYISGSSSSSGSGIDIGFQWPSTAIDDKIDTAVFENNADFGGTYDSEGNVRVLKVYWKSLRKVKKLTYYDDEGDENYEIVDENYEPKEDQGESTEDLWINEWWEGHKIGSSEEAYAIYTKMQPRPVQFRTMENPSKCDPGIIGKVYNTNDGEAVSLMDRLKTFQYLYNVFMYRTEEAFAKSYGKIMELPLHKVPDDWDMDKWLSFVHSMNIAVTDNFKEGNKGAGQGTLSGHLQQSNPVWDLEMGNYIQMHLSTLEYLEKKMGDIAGIPNQRVGETSPREAVGNVEQSIEQSSHITEYWFRNHDEVKERALTTLLETAKAAYKGKNKKVQYVLDDQSTALFDIDGDHFAESDYDVFISNSAKDQKLIDDLKNLSQSMLQNDKANVSSIIDIYMSDSVSTIREKIEGFEEEAKEEAERERKSKMKQIQQEKELEMKNKQKELELKKYDTDTEAQIDREKMLNDRLIAKIKELSSATSEDLKDDKEKALEWEKVQQDWEKLRQEEEEQETEAKLEAEKNDIEKKKINSETYNS